MMGELNSTRADLAAFPMSLIGSRPQGADLTYSIVNGGIGVLVRAFPSPIPTGLSVPNHCG